MQLVRITHDRCMEYDGATYVFAPDHWDEGRIQSLVDEAVNEYIDFAIKWEKTTEIRRMLRVPFNEYPNSTVKEVQKIYDEHNEKAKEYEKKRSKAYKQFGEYLYERGFVPFWEAEALEVEAFWGHNHGVNLDYRDKPTDTGPRLKKPIW